MLKVDFFDKKVRDEFLKYASGLNAIIAAIVLFWEIPKDCKNLAGLTWIAILFVIYFIIWYRANKLKSIDLSVDGSTVTIKTGDIFSERGLPRCQDSCRLI